MHSPRCLRFRCEVHPLTSAGAVCWMTVQVKGEQENTVRATERLQRELKQAQDKAASLEAEVKRVQQER